MTVIYVRTRVGKTVLVLTAFLACLLCSAPALARIQKVPQKVPPKVVGDVKSSDGVRIAYDTQGIGPIALVFVHGWLSDRGDWDAVANSLARRYTVVTLDLGGYGDSGRNRKIDQLKIKTFGDDVQAVAKALRLRRMILIGHNLGGDAIVEAAMSLRGQVAGLIWVDSYRNFAMLPAGDQIDGFLAGLASSYVDTTQAVARRMFSDTADAAMIERMAKKMSATPQEIAIPSVREGLVYSHQVPARLKELKLTVIAFTPEAATADEVKLMRHHGVRLLTFTGPRSFIMLEEPQRFSGMLGEAIRDILR